MIITAVCCLLRGFIAPKMENKICTFPALQTLTRKLFHPTGLSKIDEVSSRF